MIKIVLVGDSGVGKTSIAQRLVCEAYSDTHIPTIGTCFHDLTINDRAVSLWDTAGQEQYSSVTVSYLRNVSAALAVYDMSSAATVDGANRWANRVLEYSPGAHVIVIGNKKDIAAGGVSYTSEQCLPHIEVSAKTGYGIQDLHYLLSDVVSASQEEHVVLSPEPLPDNERVCC